jgi:hypothetical protein
MSAPRRSVRSGDMADMASHRAAVTAPMRDSRRAPKVIEESSSPSALPVETRASHGQATAALPPTAPAVRSPSANGMTVDVTERYLAPALKAAAAARARTARIRSETLAGAAAPARPYIPEWLLAPAVDLAASVKPRAALGSSPRPMENQDIAEIAAAWTAVGLSVAAPAKPTRLPAPPSPAASASPDVPTNRGLSVIEAARASRVAFRPMRGQITADPPQLPAAATAPTRARTLAARAKAASPAAAKPENSAPATQPMPLKSAASAPPSSPARPVTRPGAARLLPAEAARGAVPERPPRPQRFAKTIAELQRYQAAARQNEPWGKVVPRPAVPQSSPATPDSRWSRLWSRR